MSDEPGEDSLELTSSFIRWRHSGEAINSQLQLSSVDADSIYSYDEDWSFVGIRPFWEYSSFDAYERDIERTTVEWRLSPSEAGDLDWVIGLYGRKDSETLGRDYTIWQLRLIAVMIRTLGQPSGSFPPLSAQPSRPLSVGASSGERSTTATLLRSQRSSQTNIGRAMPHSNGR